MMKIFNKTHRNFFFLMGNGNDLVNAPFKNLWLKKERKKKKAK